MKEYTFYVLGRERGAIGVFYWSYRIVTAEGATMAEHILRDGFEVVRIANEVDVRAAK